VEGTVTGIAELPLAVEDRSHNLPVQLTSFIGARHA